MRVRVIRQHSLKVGGFFEECKDKDFGVIWKREGGYDVDLAPLGLSGTWGFMYDDEVEEVDRTEDLAGLLAKFRYETLQNWVKFHFARLNRRNPDGSLTIPAEELDHLLKQTDIPYRELDEEIKSGYREKSVGRLEKITSLFKAKAAQ